MSRTSNIFDLSGRWAVVTGASSGLGWRFAETLAAAGARVVVGARRTDRIRQLVQNIIEAGGQADALSLDVSNRASVEQFFLRCHDLGCGHDILVNNAGVAVTKRITDHSEAEWDTVLDTNLKGAWLMTRELVRRRAGDSPCSIVNVSSVLGFSGSSHLSSYCASKAGLSNLTRSLAVELARFGVRVNAIAPGYVETDMNRDFLGSEASDPIRRRIPMGRFGRPDDLDGALLFLCSDASQYVTGAVITVDGGMTAGL